MKGQSSRKGVSSIKRRLHLLALFFCVTSLFVLFILWRMRSEYDTTNEALGSVVTTLQQSTTNATTSPVDRSTITFDEIDPSVWQRLSPSQSGPPVLTVSKAVLTSQSSVPPGLYVAPTDQPLADGDVSGSFASGLRINTNAVALGADTTGDYISSVITGDGLVVTGGGEGATVTLNLQTGNGVTLEDGSVGLTVQTGGGLSVDSNGLTLVNTCSDGELLKWNAITTNWQCGSDAMGPGSLTVREADGAPAFGDVSVLEFGPPSGSSDEFVVSNEGGGTIRIRVGSAIALTNKDATVTGNWAFTLPVLASGGLTVNGNNYTNLAGTGLSFSSGTLASVLGNTIDSAEIVDGAIATLDIATGAITSGLILDGTITSGDIADGTISLGKLGQNGCSASQIIKWDGTAWVCATDIDTDTNTTYTAGSGLSLVGTTFSLDTSQANNWTGLQTFSNDVMIGGTTYSDLAGTGLMVNSGTLATTLGTTIDSSEIIDGTIVASDLADGTLTLAKVGQNGCATNQIIKWSGSSWTCATDVDTDTNTTYSAGSGLSLSGTTFLLDGTSANAWSGLQTFNGGLALGGNTYTNLVGTGMSFTTGTLSSVLGTSIDSSEITDGTINTGDIATSAITANLILDGTITAADIADGTLTLQKLGQNSCSSGQIIKWNGTAWACAADIDTDTNTTYSAGSGLSLTGTTFSLSLATGSGLVISGGALSLLNTCTNGQYLAWNSSSWSCTSVAAAPNLFQVVAGDSGSATADATSDTITLVGGNGLTSTAADTPDTVTFNVDLASGSGLAFSSGALTLQSCTDGQILKRVSGAWACAADNADLLAAAYKQQLAGADNVTIATSLTPLLTNGSGTAQSLGITVTSGNEVSYIATVQVSTTLATGTVNYVVIRDDNHDNDCVTGGGDGTQIGGQVATFLGSITQSFTTTIAFSDTSPTAGTNYYQLCASTGIVSGTTTTTNRSLKLDEVNL